MPRELTDLQWLTLWEISDHGGRVFRRDGDWFIVGSNRDIKINVQVRALMRRDLIALTAGDRSDENPLTVTPAGQHALTLRDYFTVIDRFNSR